MRAAKRAARSVLGIARRHWVFLALLAAGSALRAVTALAYRPALLNSGEYLSSSSDLKPGLVHPVGYSAFVRLLPLGKGLEVVLLVQHVLGLAVAVLLLRPASTRHPAVARRSRRRAGSARCVYQLNIEQNVTLSRSSELLLVGGCPLLLWRRPASLAFAGLAGIAFTAAALTRSIGLLAAVPALLTLVFLRGRISVAALATAFALPYRLRSLVPRDLRVLG